MRRSRTPTIGRRSVAVSILVLLGLVLAPMSAVAAVSVTRASLSSTGTLSVEGRGAAPRSAITVTSLESTARGTADRDGRFKFSAPAFTASDCRAKVADPSTSVTVTLTGCTPTTAPPPAGPVITPDVTEIGPGFVGSDFTTFSATTSTLTFGPDTLGPVRFEVVAGALPAGLALVNPNPALTPAKSVHASVSGTPTTVQVSSFTVRATDANGLMATRQYTIRINAARTLDLAPQAPAPTFTVGASTNWWFDGTGGVRPYRWSVSSGQLPPGMSLVQDSPDGPSVRVAGTPSTAGTFTFTLRLTDAQAATAARTFTLTVAPADTSTGPAAPTLLTPADGASVTTPFTLDWTQEFDPSLSANGGYNWQVSTTSTFSSFVLRDSTLPTVTEATVSGIAAGTYFWRVQAVDGQLRSSPYSQPKSFVVTGATAEQPGTPVLRLPSYGSAFHPFESFELFWTAAERAARYELLASKDPTFQTNPIKVDNITTTSTGLTIGDFCGGCEQGTYSARVVAIDAEGRRGLPSNTVSFTISYDAPLPPAPTALSPAAGATVTLPVTLDWSDVPNPQPNGYEIFVARDAGFTDVEMQGRTSGSQTSVLSLTSGTKYWRVYAVQGNDAPDSPALTAPSTTRSFTVGSAGGVAVQSVWLGAPPCTDPCPGADTLSSGQEITGSIQLTTGAPSGGAVVSLSSSPASGASHPTTVTVPAGTAFATFQLFAGEVTQDTPVTLTATLGSSSDTFAFTVRPTTVKQLTFCCDSTGGLPASAHLSFTGTVPAGGVVVALSSDSPLARPPATVTVPAGSFSIPVSIPTSEVTATTTTTISATLNGTTVSAPLTLYPQQPPTSLVLDRTSATGTQGTSGTVRIAEAQGHVVQMQLASSHPEIATPQPYAQIGSFGVAGSFTITTTAPTVSTDVTISATGAGVTLTTVLTVHPVSGPGGGPTASGLSLSPTTVTGGQTSTGTVTLSAPAPTGGASVALTSSDAGAATVPSSVTVPAGATGATFTVTSKAVTATASTTLTATLGGVARTAVLTVTPSPQGATLTVTATGRSGARVTSSPAGLNVTVGSTGSASFPAGTAITLSASDGRDVIWSGACSSNGSKARTCSFTLTGPASVTANVQ